MIAGIDIGYSHTKIASATKFRFPSIVGNVEVRRWEGLPRAEQGPILILTTEDGRWAIGSDAAASSRFTSRREDRNWIESAEYQRLYLAALSCLTAAKYTRISLVTGLPVDYIADRHRLKERLMGRFRFSRADRPHRQLVEVDQVEVIPQPFGTLLLEILDRTGRIVNHDLATSTVGIIDVGGKTTSYLSVKDAREIPAETGSIPVGCWESLTLARELINRELPGLELADYEVAEAAQNSASLRYYGENRDVSGMIRLALEPLAEQVIAEATQRWGNGARLDAILVTGGGAELVGQAICRHFRHARIVEEPAYANVLGYYRFARRHFSRLSGPAP